MGSLLEKEPWRLNATEAVALLRNGDMTVESYAKSLLSRIEQRDSQVRAWVHLDADLVLQRARELDAVPAEKRGPLHGIAVGVKDVFLTKDMPTQYNSPIFESKSPIAVDAACVATLRSAGALIFGKTTTTEFAATYQGGWHQNHTANAHDPNRTPGGSSSGSSAAVGDFQVPIALGTQTGGSMIRPGSFNGIYGFKPTWGAISREGLGQFTITCDTVGLFARSAKDLELLSDVFRLRDDEVRPFRIQGAKIAFLRTHVWPKAGKGLVGVWERAKELVAQGGATVEEVELPKDFANLAEWHKIVLAGEGRSSFLGQYTQAKDLLNEFMVGHVENSDAISRKKQLEAYDGCARLRPLWDEIASRYDAVITPGTPDEAPVGLSKTGDAAFCTMWTILHAPMLTVPGMLGLNGMPIGLSIVGARYTDQHVVQVGEQIGSLFQGKGEAL